MLETLVVGVFWGCTAILVYTYAGYPALAWLMSSRRDGRTAMSTRPMEGRVVSVIVAAYNEEGAIAARLENLAALEVSRDTELEVIVASDGSTDRTAAIVTAWPDPRVRLLELPRGGRAMAHNRAVRIARGDILVFTDARTSFCRGALERLVNAFEDPDVGCVVGRLLYVPEPDSIAQDTAGYWKYETYLRRWESAAGLLAVGTGCCMGVRRSSFRELAPDEDVDDGAPLDVLQQGRRVVFAPEAVAYDIPPGTAYAEVRARARMTVLGLNAIRRRVALLNPFRCPRPALALWSHRVFRSMTPVLVVGAFLSTLPLLHRSPYLLAFAAQAVFYGLALLGWLGRFTGLSSPIVRIPMSFCVWNVGFAAGLVTILRGRTLTRYEPV